MAAAGETPADGTETDWRGDIAVETAPMAPKPVIEASEAEPAPPRSPTRFPVSPAAPVPSPAPEGAGGSPAAAPIDPALPAEPEPVSSAVEEPDLEMDHCKYGYDPHPTDATMADGPAEYYPEGHEGDASLVDLTVQPEVIEWMESKAWQAIHLEWHAIRTCALPAAGATSKVDICEYVELVPTDQHCTSEGDGYQFLLFHRHMMQALKQLWPNHTEQFEGFERFPQSAEDVPEQWRDAWRPFSETAIANGKIGDEIDKPENLALFENEGILGFWLQCQAGQLLGDFATSGIHFEMHDHWVRPGNTRHGVGNTESNVDNYMFYKLHGWIDDVWEKYRVAKGITQDDPKYKAALEAQCREMEVLERIIRERLPPEEVAPSAELPEESGTFHEQVRPIFESMEARCAGCHSESGPEAGMSLGGLVSSADIVAGLVEVPTRGGGQYRRVVPGQPEQSWLYLKAAGLADESGCAATDASMCLTGVMPPDSSGVPTLSDEQLGIIEQWILDGAPGPE